MKNLITLTFLIFLCSFVYSQQEKNIENLDAYLEQSLKDWNVPGMAIAIVKDGKVILSKGYGVRDINSRKKVDENTVFPIASITKSFTSAAMSILVDEGKINWDDKVVDYLPYFKLYDPYVTANMTIEDLLCHRSGLETFSGDLIWYGSDYNREEVIEKASLLLPKYGFREHFGYSNIMYIAAGEIIEKVSGKSWDDFIMDNFFNTLGMVHSVTSIDDLKGNNNVTKPHNDVGDKVISIDLMNWDNIGGAGAINSSVSDLTKWIMLQLNEGEFNGKNIFSKDQSYFMLKPHTILDNRPSPLWESTHFKSYGLGWNMFDYKGVKVVGHSGGYDGVISYLAFVPEEDFGFVILTNKNSAIYYALQYKILDYFLSDEDVDWSKIILGFVESNKKLEEQNKIKEEENRIKDTKPSHDLKSFSGLYESKIYGDAKVYIDGENLYIQMLHTEIFTGKLTHWHYNTFEIEMIKVPSLPKGKVTFDVNDKGIINNFVIDIPNPDFDFTEFEFVRK